MTGVYCSAIFEGAVTGTNAANVVALSPNSGRQYLLIQNTSAADIYVRFGSVASASAPSFKLAAGASLIFGDGAFVPSQALNIYSVAASTFTIWHA